MLYGVAMYPFSSASMRTLCARIEVKISRPGRWIAYGRDRRLGGGAVDRARNMYIPCIEAMQEHRLDLRDTEQLVTGAQHGSWTAVSSRSLDGEHTCDRSRTATSCAPAVQELS